jgi:hypothetical protein
VGGTSGHVERKITDGPTFDVDRQDGVAGRTLEIVIDRKGDLRHDDLSAVLGLRESGVGVGDRGDDDPLCGPGSRRDVGRLSDVGMKVGGQYTHRRTPELLSS